MDKGRGDSQKMPGLTASVCQNGSVALSGAACPGRSGTPALTLPRISSRTTARAFRGFRFPAEVILWAVRWYLQFPISYRDLEAMLADRGVEVDHTTMYRWVQRFAPELEKRQASSNHRGPQAASAVAASRSAFQAHGNKHASSCALVWPETVRSSTSVSQACGSTPFSFAVATRLATIAQCRAPPSEP